MSESLVTGNNVAPKKKPRKAAASGVVEVEAVETAVEDDVVAEESFVAEKSPIPEKNVAKASGGKKFVFFASGSAYVTKSGFRFSSEKRIYELDLEEADHLLSLDNFRLPDQLELEDYYKENN
jgi:hypothetical protein